MSVEKLRQALEADDPKRLLVLCKKLDKNHILKAGGYKNTPELEMSVAHHLANKTYGLECLKVLVAKIGPNCLKCTDSHGDTPLHMIALNQGEDWIEWINKTLGPSCFEIKGQFHQNPVHRAAQNTRSNSALACMIRICGGACLTAQDEYTNMPIHYAAWKQGPDSMELIKRALGNRYFDQKGQCGRTLVHWAAMNEGSHEVLKWLVNECGQNSLTLFDDHGNLPIHLAALFQSADSIQFIVDKMGSHVLTAKADKGATVVQMAAKNPNNSALARCVARLGPSCLLDRDSRGQTPAHLAAQYQSMDSIRLIAQSLGVSAFKTLKDGEGISVEDYATRNKDGLRLLSWISEQQMVLERLPQNQRQQDENMLQNLMLKIGIQQPLIQEQRQPIQVSGVQKITTPIGNTTIIGSQYPDMNSQLQIGTPSGYISMGRPNPQPVSIDLSPGLQRSFTGNPSQAPTMPFPSHQPQAYQQQPPYPGFVVPPSQPFLQYGVQSQYVPQPLIQPSQNVPQPNYIQQSQQISQSPQYYPPQPHWQTPRNELLQQTQPKESGPSTILDPNFTSWEFILDNGRRQQIGKGGFGTVYKAITNKHQTVAVKVVQVPEACTAAEVQRAIQSEENGIKILKSIQHPNILTFLRSERTKEGDFCIFTELISGYSLHELMKRQNKPIDESGVKKFSQQICAALNFLHCKQPPVLHRDIKCQNIMLTNEGFVKLIDFGLAKEIVCTIGQSTSLCGTWYFMAPELFATDYQLMYTPKTDVWAFGCTVFEMFTMEPPNIKIEQRHLPKAICSKEMPELPPTASAELRDFYSRCVVHSTQYRADTTELLRHRFLQAY